MKNIISVGLCEKTGKGTILESIGNTPIVKIRNVPKEIKQVEIYAKLEWFNPGGSVKDRPALWMIKNAIAKGTLTKDKIILEATSGNMGIALAMIGSVLKYRIELCMPMNASNERKKILKGYGAKVILTDPLEGIDGSIRLVDEMCSKECHKYFRPDQYNSPYNPLAHYETTGVEIFEQTHGMITHFIAGVGTAGTMMGTGKRLKEFDENIQIIGVEPDCPLHGLEGLKHMATSIVPGIYNENFLDDKICVATESAYEMVRRLAREDGLFVGKSSGAAMVASIELAKKIKEGIIVTIFPDGGEKYLSTPVWD